MLLAFFLFGTVSGLLAPRSDTKAAFSTPDQPVPNHYIVRFHDGHSLEDHYANIGLNISAIAVEFMHWEDMNAYHFRLSDDASSYLVHDLIRHDQGVAHVMQNEYTQWSNDDHINEPSPTDQSPPTKRWDLDTHPSLWYNHRMISFGVKDEELVVKADANSKAYEDRIYDYPLLSTAGEGVDVYVVDSGIRLSHNLFDGRAKNFNDKKATDKSPYCQPKTGCSDMSDEKGHGTHVAGIIAGRNGVAPLANVISVKVACETTVFNQVQAFKDILAAHNAKKDNPPNGWKGSVINVSMDMTSNSQSLLREALVPCHDAGIPIAASAGNRQEGGSRPLAIPANWKFVMAVGAVNQRYDRWPNSAHGLKLNIFAPGAGITSLSGSSDWGYQVLSGTSQASPHVAAVMAIIVGNEGYQKLKTGQDVYDRIIANKIDEVTVDSDMNDRGTPRYLLQTGINNPKRGINPYAGIP